VQVIVQQRVERSGLRAVVRSWAGTIRTSARCTGACVSRWS